MQTYHDYINSKRPKSCACKETLGDFTGGHCHFSIWPSMNIKILGLFRHPPPPPPPPKPIMSHRRSCSCCYQCTVVILINATTLMHKSNLSRHNFGNNHFGQTYQKQNFLRIFTRLWGCLFEKKKFPTNTANTIKCVFGQIFHSFENFVTLKT